MEGVTDTGESENVTDEWTMRDGSSAVRGVYEWISGKQTRTISAQMGARGSGIVVESEDRRLYVNLPARLDAVVDVEESYRTEPYRVNIELVRDDSGREPRAVVDSVTVSRAGGAQVTAGALRSLRLGELVDFMLTREPTVERSARDAGPGVLAPGGMDEALRVAGRRTGKRTSRDVDLATVAETYLGAPSRSRVRAVSDLLGVGKRSALRRIAEAREAGRLPPRD